ncbi:hypothetical protein AVEN_268862-1 [Araneus ventricosus]|uniref:Uncharacterized protein n=1 Tax=Araneus ventricosus TaxID=182803 RepID=A0A4Y2EUP4_ARAVE|nr:hypothetical protein AVEN_268862-1 [Araneus ventricosus]
MDRWLKTGTLKRSVSRTEIRTTDLAAMEITVDQQDDNHEVQRPTDWPVQCGNFKIFENPTHGEFQNTPHDKLEPENSANIKFAETKTPENCNLSVFQVTPEVQKAAKEYSVKRCGPKTFLSSSVCRRSPNCPQDRIGNVKCELQSILPMVKV